MQAVIQSGADKVFYISCNPATLARDLKTLCEVYNIDRVTPFDMFPQTRHVETLVLLSKKKPDSHIVVDASLAREKVRFH